MAAGDPLRIKVTEPGTGVEMAALERATDADLIEAVVQYDSTGNLITATNGVPTKNAILTATTGTLVSANTPVSAAVVGMAGASIGISGTYAAFTLFFEQSLDGGTTWAGATATSGGAAGGEIEQQTLAIGANGTQNYAVTLLPGATNMRVSGFGSGPSTGTANIRIVPSAMKAPNAQVVRIDANANASRVRLFDGQDEATILPVRSVPSTGEKVQVVAELPVRMPTFQAVTAEVAPAITIGVKELLNFFHPAAVTVDVYIVEIVVSVLVTTASTGTGRTNVEVFKSTTVGTGGTNLAAADVGGGLGTSAVITNAAANVMQAKTGGGTLGTALIRQGVEYGTQPLGLQRIEIFKASSVGNGIILRGGSADGINVQVNRVAAHTALVDQWTASMRWLEI